MPTLNIPETLLKFTNGASSILLDAASTATMRMQLKHTFPDLYHVLFNPQGEINGFVNIYLNQQMLDRAWGDHPLNPADHLTIITAVSGG
jgi:hypothetical protein